MRGTLFSWAKTRLVETVCISECLQRMLRDKNKDFLGSETDGALHSEFYRIASG